jgi:hypothetical protein
MSSLNQSNKLNPIRSLIHFIARVEFIGGPPGAYMYRSPVRTTRQLVGMLPAHWPSALRIGGFRGGGVWQWQL